MSLQFDTNFAAATQSKIISLTIAVFLKYHDDPYLLEHVQDMLKILCQNPFCLQPLQERIVPTLVSAEFIFIESTSMLITVIPLPG